MECFLRMREPLPLISTEKAPVDHLWGGPLFLKFRAYASGKILSAAWRSILRLLKLRDFFCISKYEQTVRLVDKRPRAIG